jgi:hypothetical protein
MLNWTKETPQENGDYLWIEQWDCGCLIKSGIAFILDGEISWEGQKPNFLQEKPIVDFWAKIKLPPGEHNAY